MNKANLVIVESPAKAKTINKYLGSDFEVLASFGHVRDLLPKDGAVKPEEDFALVWDVGAQGSKHLKAISDACKSAKHLYLATDPDREGEAISWHVLEELGKRKALQNIESVDRIVFHEITEQAVKESLQNPRPLDQKLVDAYLARRVLDYLVGFNLSPVLWRKLPGAKSAGRVQSVALRLICDREQEIEAFDNQEYWSVIANCKNAEGASFEAKLVRHKGEELDKLSLQNEAQAAEAVAAVQAGQFTVGSVEQKQKMRHAYAPFTTSTLQQDASRRLNFGTSRTMQIAQKLYEGVGSGGLITYMRTDSTALSSQALGATRKVIVSEFGDAYLPEKPNFYKTKTKNAQEAHEAIRPTNLSLTPKQAAAFLTDEQAKLYELIWKRTVASQMKSAVLDMTSVLIESADKQTAIKANGSVIRFDGFLKLYTESKSFDPNKDDDDDDKRILPPMNQGDNIACQEVTPNQHFTQPPPRYSEASLVKKMEEIGIGRPSTYASVLKILQDREYVELDSKRFIPKQRGRLVTVFLSGFFEKYVDYEFTAAMEDNLDEISRGQAEWKNILQEFWQAFYDNTQKALDLPFPEVRAEIDKALSGLFFAKDENGSDEAARKCPLCDGGRLAVNFGKYGMYVNCSNYPECRYTQQGKDVEDGIDGNDYPKYLGEHEAQKVQLMKGPYGFYVQQGEGKKDEVKRTGLPKTMKPEEVDFAIALKLLELPRLIGTHPDSSDEIHAGLGRYGPYLKYGAKYVSLGEDDDVLEIGLNRAVEVIATKATKGRSRSEPLKELGKHPEDDAMVALYKGPYGHYVKWNKVNAGIPKDREPTSVTMEEALLWLDAKLKNPPKKKFSKKSRAKKSSAKKPA